ncbi:MAG: right-handed parallel beta-helix repeat-containing protein, partial [Aureliella sp.]
YANSSAGILLLLVSLTSPAWGADGKAAIVNARDYPNLQAALDAIPEQGGELRLPPGTVEITEPLRLGRGDVRLIGAGTSTHIVNKNESGQPALIVAPSEDQLKKDAKSRLWRIELTDFRITGNPKSGHGIDAKHVDELLVEGVSCSYHGGHGLHMKDCYEDPRIIGCLFTYNKACGVLLDGCHDIVVSANQFEEDEDALKCVDSFNLCMNGNNIDDHLRHGIIIENTYGSVVSGNMIEECNGTAIILDRDCYGITLSSNVIAHHLKGGIDLKDAWGCSVSANTLVLVHEFGVRVSDESGRLAITGNNFSNSYIGGKLKRENAKPPKDPMQLDAGSGIFLESTEDIAISGNQFSGLGTAAVSTSGDCQRIVLQGNLAAECGKLLKDDGKSPWFDLRKAKDSEASGNIPKNQVAQ